ncbi:GNAT family N-acetyltransferase [uncultured Streptomyces sp.]|uniref:GNAT family N-acetyltransferase n=1 Tax=uncultured Streptomyces sp. TaxID=174707 RepID=UPI00261EE08C|nr:GNAT family N-acetyltransferase [uncultured Streptomyces sp.]
MPPPSPRSLPESPIRLLSRSDLRACADLSEDRGWPRDEHRWGLLLSAGTAYGIESPEDEGILAACVVTSYGLDLAAIGMMLVAARHARQGLGMRLMRHVIESHGSSPLSLYATAEGRPLYGTLGFRPVGTVERLVGHLRPGHVPDGRREPAPSGVLTRPARAADLRAIVDLDRKAFGADRDHVLARLPAFSDRFVVAEAMGELVGYAALWPSEETHVLGPLIAQQTSIAQLLVTSLAAATDRPLRVEIDDHHQELLGWLRENGLQAASTTTLMVRGCAELPGDRAIRFAPLTVATG